MKALSPFVVSVFLYISFSGAHAIPIEGWPPEFSPTPVDEWLYYPTLPPLVPDEGIDISPWPVYPVPAAPLEARLNGLAFYDPNLNITWARNAAIGGAMTRDATRTWLATLELGGVTGWRIPRTGEVLYLVGERGVSASNPEPFMGLTTSFYFTQEVLFGDLFQPMIGFGSGSLIFPQFPGYEAYVIPVYDGDVGISQIDEPVTLALMAGGLLGLALVKRIQ